MTQQITNIRPRSGPYQKNAKRSDSGTLKAADVPLQEASRDIWNTKYRLRGKDGRVIDKTIDDTYQRVARALADVEIGAEKREQWYEKFLFALRVGAIPAGRIVSNAGALEHKPATSTINCTVSGIVRDSMDDILRKVHEAGLTLKAGCGIGYEFSTLRPKGAFVAGAGAHTSGPLSFMDIYDKMCFTVSSAGGRRGAQMATFDVGHPDVMNFIRVKREDGRLRQFNLSLLITRDFMAAVHGDLEWQLAFPVTEAEIRAEDLDPEDPTEIVWRDWPVTSHYFVNADGKVACKVYKTLRARRVWDAIMTSTYDFAEPGFILVDKINEMNNNWFCEDIRATNPCVTADTWIRTEHGARQVSALIGKSFVAMVDGKNYPSGSEGFFRTATKPVVCLQTTEGYRLRLTRDHRVRRVTRFERYDTETEWCEAGELRSGDRVLLNDHRACTAWKGEYNAEQGYLMGLLVGDGTLKTDKAVLSVWKPAAVANGGDASLPNGVLAVMAEALSAASGLPHRSDFTGWQEIPGRNEYRLATAAIRQLAFDLGMRPGDKSITPVMERASSEFTRGFLRGLFDADGSVQGDQRKGVSVRLAQSNLSRLQAVQRMLLRLGIASRIYRDRRPAGTKILPDGRGAQREYAIKAQHELVISGENLLQFRNLIGFADT
ncbi:MAG: ribonucleoside-diphosphate reductase, partial [Gammaproteobacteria bacterium]|nr:ribonucleoside-diphosphate reductase [Gammaproteobacteria bacterium]NNJ84479.1 ribonucleoside-diphosphate reductase [Gammaproteobacteria bacterium]